MKLIYTIIAPSALSIVGTTMPLGQTLALIFKE